MVQLKICCGRKSQLVVLYQVVTHPCCGLAVTFCGFISRLIGHETINISEIFSGIHGFIFIFLFLFFLCGRRGGLMVSALDSGASGPGSSPRRGQCVVFLGKTLYSHSASLHPGV